MQRPQSEDGHAQLLAAVNGNFDEAVQSVDMALAEAEGAFSLGAHPGAAADPHGHDVEEIYEQQQLQDDETAGEHHVEENPHEIYAAKEAPDDAPDGGRAMGVGEAPELQAAHQKEKQEHKSSGPLDAMPAVARKPPKDAVVITKQEPPAAAPPRGPEKKQVGGGCTGAV